MIVDPADYGRVLKAIAENGGATTLGLRRELAQKAYARTARYDAAISAWFARELSQKAPPIAAFAGPASTPSSAMARTRTNGRPSTAPARPAPAWQARGKSRARRSPTTI